MKPDEVGMIFIMVLLAIFGFMAGYNWNDGDCNIDFDQVRGFYDDHIGKDNLSANGDLRFLHEDMTLRQFWNVYDSFYPISKIISESALEGLCS